MKVINVIQDVGLPVSRKRSRDFNSDEPLVVTMPINNCVIKRILIDNESSTNISFKNTFHQMDISWDQMIPYSTPLVGFAG